MRFLIVTKFVSMPPSQRLLTYGIPARVASWATGSWACFLVPTNRTSSPRATVSRTRLEGDVEPLDGLGEVDDVDPVALREDERAHLGVPATRLVAEVDSGLEQLPHRNGRHGWRPPVRFVPPRASSSGTGPRRSSRRGAGTTPVRDGSACGLRPGEWRSARALLLAARRPSRAPDRAECSTGSGSNPDAGLTNADPMMPDREAPAPAAVGGSTTTRSNRSGQRGTGVAVRQHAAIEQSEGRGPDPGALARGRRSPPAGRTARSARQRTSTTTRAGGGPGSTATRSSSWRPTWTFRAEDGPASGHRDGRRPAFRRRRRACWAAVRSLSEGWSAIDAMVSGSAHPAVGGRQPAAHPAEAAGLQRTRGRTRRTPRRRPSPGRARVRAARASRATPTGPPRRSKSS